MSEAPYATRDSLSREREDAAASGDTQDQDAGSQHQHKPNAFLKFFKGSSRSTTPRPELVGGSDRSVTPGAGLMDEQEMEDHLAGTTYTASELCPGCGFPRGSSVYCPVTRRHHGTNELMESGRHHHSRTTSGSKGIFAKIFSKFPTSSGQHSDRVTPVNDDTVAPATENHMPSSHDDNTGEMDRATRRPKTSPRYTNGTGGDGVGISVSPESASDDQVHQPADHGTDHAADEGDAGAGAAGAEEGGEGHVQYYCYTDANGETFYYTAELQESMHEHHSATADAQVSQPEAHPEGAAADHDANADEAPPGSYIGEYVDENGQTVQYLYTPEPGAAEPPAEEEAEAESADATAAATTTSARAAAGGSDDGSLDAAGTATGDGVPTKRKSPTKFFSAITNVFKSSRSTENRRATHADPAAKTGSSSTPPPAAGDGAPSAEDGDVEAAEQNDREVDAYVTTLDAAQKKKFLKERKNLVKELTSAEKKAREALVKERHEYVEETARQKRAGAFALKKDESAVKSGRKRGEPL